MLFEHDEGRGYVKAMITAHTNKDTQTLTENASAYCRLLREHIYKEDNILYPMAEDALSDAMKNIINNEYAAVAKDCNTQAVWAKYQELYTELKNYLG